MIRKLETKELGKLYRKHIKKDFLPMERPPCFVIKSNMNHHTQEGFIYVQENQELGYTICSIAEEIILISLFAVFKGARGKGNRNELFKRNHSIL